MEHMDNWSTLGVWNPCVLMRDKVQLHCCLREGGANTTERLHSCHLGMAKKMKKSVSWGLVVGFFCLLFVTPRFLQVLKSVKTPELQCNYSP